MVGGLVKAFGSVAAVGLVLYGGVYMFSSRVQENEIGMKIVRGALENESVEAGVKMDTILPHVEYREFTRTLVTGEVKAGQDDDVTIRTKDKLRVYGGFKFKFTLTDKDPNWSKAYTFLKASNAEDMIDDIGDFLMPAAIDVYSEIESDDINSNLIEIGKKILERAQKTLDDKGLTFIRLDTVIPTGMGLSPEADTLIEQQATEQRRLSIDATRRQLAAQQQQTIQDQVKVTTNALRAFKDAGLDNNQALYALCLQQQRDGDVLGVAAPCIPAGSNMAVSIAKQTQSPKTKTLAPSGPGQQ